jgi:hypothetical protein
MRALALALALTAATSCAGTVDSAQLLQTVLAETQRTLLAFRAAYQAYCGGEHAFDANCVWIAESAQALGSREAQLLARAAELAGAP